MTLVPRLLLETVKYGGVRGNTEEYGGIRGNIPKQTDSHQIYIYFAIIYISIYSNLFFHLFIFK